MTYVIHDQVKSCYDIAQLRCSALSTYGTVVLILIKFLNQLISAWSTSFFCHFSTVCCEPYSHVHCKSWPWHILVILLWNPCIEYSYSIVCYLSSTMYPSVCFFYQMQCLWHWFLRTSTRGRCIWRNDFVPVVFYTWTCFVIYRFITFSVIK